MNAAPHLRRNTNTESGFRSESPLPQPQDARRAMGFAVVAATTAVIWLTLLSGWLTVTPGSVIVQRSNVLFNSDTNTWINEVVNGDAPSAADRVIHPLDAFLWRAPCSALRAVLQIALPSNQAGLLASRLLVAAVAGAGVGWLAWLARALGVAMRDSLLLFAVYLLFTANSTIALPEHFGLSNGLLSAAFVLPIFVTHRHVRTLLVAGLVPLCGGTTVTNALFPLSAIYQWSVESPHVRRAILVAVIGALPIAIFLFVDSRKVVLVYTDTDKEVARRVSVLPAHVPAVTRWYLKTTKLHGHVIDYLNLRLIHHPADALEYALFAVIAPAVGPAPEVRTTKGADMVTYESGQPLRWDPNGYFRGADARPLRRYGPLQAVGAVCWLVLFGACAYMAFRDGRTRPLAWLPAGWILFNIVLHNVWGDELFLYAPHWSWALMALVVLGARRLSTAAVPCLVVPIVSCQVYALTHIRQALLTIVR
jgi:hypothetical protein